MINTIIVSIIVFIASKSLTTDPVDQILSTGLAPSKTSIDYDQEYRRLSHKMGLDQPIFYFSFGRQSSPDTLYKIPRFRHEYVNMLIRENGNWPVVQSYLTALDSQYKNQGHAHTIYSELYRCKNLNEIKKISTRIHNQEIKPEIDLLLNAQSRINHFIPKLSWHGNQNQFHNWAKKILIGDFGLSSIDGRLANTKILEAIQWTFILNALALLSVFLIGISIGTWSGYSNKTRLIKFLNQIMYMFYAVPIFWLATILIVFFTTDDYGQWTNWFPSVGLLNSSPETNIISRFLSNYKYMILPLICLILPSLAYLARQMESSISAEQKKRYTLFLKSQGHSKKSIYYKYLFKNALIPIITILGQAIPSIISGSLVIEIIFNIPGLGRLIYESIFANDWNVVFQLVIITALIIMISYLMVDLLYKWINPQIDLQA